MARKVIYKENGFLGTTDTPSGYRYLGYDGTTLSEKTGATISAISGGSGSTPNITQVLTQGNTVGDGLTLDALNGGGQLDLRFSGVNNTVALTNDSGSAGSGYLVIDDTASQIGNLNIGGYIAFDIVQASFALTNISSTQSSITMNSSGNTSITLDETDGINLASGIVVGNGRSVKITSLPTYADDTAAGTAGLVTNQVYKTSTGELRIKL